LIWMVCFKINKHKNSLNKYIYILLYTYRQALRNITNIYPNSEVDENYI